MPARWTRIHSLPKAKRYPESTKEKEEILRRHNAVANYVLGDSPCILFFPRFGESKSWSNYDIKKIRNSGSFKLLNSFTPEYVMSCAVEDHDGPIQIFGARQAWHANKFDKLILESAEDRTGPLLFANVAKGTAYAPYDGGADLFLESPESVVLARKKFLDWLPDTASGL